jgi:hypothetical protein
MEYLLKVEIVVPGETAIARQRLYKHARIAEPSLSNLRTNKGETVGSSVFYAVRSEAT